MPSDLTAAEVVSAAAPVAGALGITVRQWAPPHVEPGVQFFDNSTGDTTIACPADAARLLVGMVEERIWSGVVCELEFELDEDASDDLRTLFLLTMRAYARAAREEGEKHGKAD